MKRIFICTNSQYPFGNANSNYIRMLSLALHHAEWKVIVLGCGENRIEDAQPNDTFAYKQIEYINLSFVQNKLPFCLAGHFSFGRHMIRQLQQYGVSANDYILIYSAYVSLANEILRHFKSWNDGHLAITCVEWFQAYQYRLGALNPAYQLWKYDFQYKMPTFKKTIAVSKKLKKFFEAKGGTSLIVPPLIDRRLGLSEQELESLGASYGLLNFMYSGTAGNKDSIDKMIEALAHLDDSELGRIRLHFTAIKKEYLSSIMANRHELLSRLENCIVYHDWLDYDRLIALYREIDFLLLMRKENTVTVSNFPSKIPEMMNQGVIPICSNVGDCAKLYLTDGVDSFQFIQENISSCCWAVRRALALDEKALSQMKANAVHTAQNQFDFRNWGKRIDEFLLTTL